MKALVITFEKSGKLLPVSLEAFSAAKLLADEITAVCVDHDGQYEKEASGYCEKVIQIVSEYEPEPQELTDAIAEIAKKEQADYVVFPGTVTGKELTGGTAAKLEGIGFSQVTHIERKEREIIFTRPVFSGMIYEHIRTGRNPVVFSVKQGSFAAAEKGTTEGILECFQIPKEKQGKRIEKVKVVTEITQNANLEEADIVVAGGRGVGDADGFRLVEKLADALGGMTGATRMAIDNGWIDRTHQVGQSGKSVSPKLYIACGISGAVQHTCGISDQSFLVAINKDEEAPIFKIADLGIVGDVKKVLPEMIREVREQKIARKCEGTE